MPGDLIRLMHAMFLPAAEGCRSALWQPAVDVYRTRHGWLIKAELAGVRPKDIHLSVAGNRIRLEGSRRDWFLEEGSTHYRMEISYSQFERTLELPCCLDAAKITTEFQYGLLLVRVETEADK
jgi:HSP20 family protein